MSVHCTSRVWDHASQRGSPLLLLLAIADYADENGFAFPGLATLAEKIRMSHRQTRRLVARLEEASELLVLRREGRGNLYVVRTAAGREALAAALDRAVRMGAALPGGTLERTLDNLLRVEPEPVTSRPATGDTLSTGDRILSPDIALSPDKATSPDKALSRDKATSPTGDNPGASGDNSRPTGDIAVTARGDIATSPDPSLTVVDPPGSVRDPSGGVLWDRALQYLPLYMERRTFDHWLRGTRALALEGDCLVVDAHTPYAVDWLEHRLAPIIDRALRTHLPGYRVRFVAPGTGSVPGSGTEPGTEVPRPAARRSTPRIQAVSRPRTADPAPSGRTQPAGGQDGARSGSGAPGGPQPAAGRLYALSGPESASGSTRTPVRGWPFPQD